MIIIIKFNINNKFYYCSGVSYQCTSAVLALQSSGKLDDGLTMSLLNNSCINVVDHIGATTNSSVNRLVPMTSKMDEGSSALNVSNW